MNEPWLETAKLPTSSTPSPEEGIDMNPADLLRAYRAGTDHVLSARPDAPVVPDRPRAGRLRHRAARGLRRLAAALDPVRPVGPEDPGGARPRTCAART